MAQIFRPSANTVSRASLFSLILIPGILIVSLTSVTRSGYNTRVDIPLDQPIPFSHQHHAFELGIDCRYCHSSVEKSSVAGVPPTHTCMSCHSQIWTNSPLLEPVRQSYQTGVPIKWNRVNKVPDFVYFNHSIHVERGIHCNTCHGPVQQMQLTFKGKAFFMSWCLECHRNPEKYMFTVAENADPQHSPRQQVFDLYTKYQNGEKLTPAQYSLLVGKDYAPSAQEISDGKALVDKYNVNVKQLEDCWVCHR